MMTPLEIYLSNRHEPQAERAYRWILTTGKISKFVGKWAAKLLFSKRYGHMRFIPPELSIKVAGPGSWALSLNGNSLAKTLPLLDLVDSISRPVSIIASGPSALDYPWENLRGGSRFIVAVNGSASLLKKHGIKPDMMVVIDDQFCLTGAEHFAAAAGVPLVIEMVAGATWASRSPDDFKNRRVTFMERVNSWYALPKLSFEELKQINHQSERPWILPEQMEKKCRVGWSQKPELGFFSGRTVTFAALQVVIRLGAKDIEIIGMDLGGRGRAYEELGEARPSYLENHYAPFILPSFEAMSRAITGSGVKIRNLSPVCPLPMHLFGSCSLPPVLGDPVRPLEIA
jgi:Kdo-III transferase WaaZ